ncbi:DUF2093 domain-containing protein [Erythrobacter arachoides]|uniref:DUF2093 domain-containing protein n=1 Tax=Aurantiacibacter arachoides TaxID=1850444 RepID=A0A845AAK3_9SPHN|nr:DUF2093 domain-containing protein [Aurantiacibacter arachoides]MXO94589.1 DUF2093 domain-containing protein [Aurantiacibacter arachoides]GGD62290.1 hypothetical protein GCM10011411_23160 [Aurantiacibacter arachoides]
MLMNSSDTPATLVYGPNGFRVIRPGHFVACAVSGAPVPLEELRYWSVDLQEAYASAELATKRATDGL